MASEVIAGIGIFKSLFDIARGLKDINDATIRNSAILELQEKILEAREAQATLIEHISELEAKIASFDNWTIEKEKYQLVEIEPDSFAYSIKEVARGTEPAHLICTTCFEKRIKSILQRQDLGHMRCPTCGSSVRLRDPRKDRPVTREGITWGR